MSAPTGLEAAREVAQQKLDNALGSMPPRSRAHTEIDVQVPIGALRTLIAATTPPTDDVRELVDQAKSHLERIEGEWGSSRSYEQLLERGDDEAAVIERVDRFLRGSAEKQRS